MTTRHPLSLGLVLALLAGCAPVPSAPESDARFGVAVRSILQQQTLDPQASERNAQSLAATDGRSTAEAGERYLDSWRKPPPTTVINVLGGSGAGAAR